MDSSKYPSILSDIDISLERGTELVDPFNLLDVKSIKSDPQFTTLFENIDIENLYSETIDFNIESFQHLISEILIDDNDKDSILRFSWWICRELVFGPEGKHIINITDLLKNQSNSKDNYVKVCIYAGFNSYKLAIINNDQSQILIKFNNNSVLS